MGRDDPQVLYGSNILSVLQSLDCSAEFLALGGIVVRHGQPSGIGHEALLSGYFRRINAHLANICTGVLHPFPALGFGYEVDGDLDGP